MSSVDNHAGDALITTTGCAVVEARKAVAVLLGGYSRIPVHDERAFISHLPDLMAEYPADICFQAARDIPRIERYLNVAAVREYLEAQMHKRRATLSAAAAERERAKREVATLRHRREASKLDASFAEWLRHNPDGRLFEFGQALLCEQLFVPEKSKKTVA